MLGGPPEGLYLPRVSASNPHSSHETGGRAGGAGGGGGAGGYLCSEKIETTLICYPKQFKAVSRRQYFLDNIFKFKKCLIENIPFKLE